MNRSGNYYEYQGSIHIHTTDSDGSKPLEEVAQIAASAGLDFIFVSDHMTLRARQAGKEGYYGRTFVVIGYEHNDLEDCNHYLVFGTDSVMPAEMTAPEYVAEARRQGALGIIAHPDEVRPRVGKFPSYPWLAWDARGYDGIEIWNQMSEWMENLTAFNQIKMLLSPRRFLKSPTDRILQIWDDANRARRVAGIGGVDVHAFPYKIGPIRITIFPYKVQFKSIQTHLLLAEELSGDTEGAKKQLFEAIRDCRLFVCNHRWGNGCGFEFKAARGGQEVISGGKIDDFKDTHIKVECPESANIRLLANGIIVAQAKGKTLDFPTVKNGLYRAEAYKGTKGWIFSNHIRVGV